MEALVSDDNRTPLNLTDFLQSRCGVCIGILARVETFSVAGWFLFVLSG